MLFGTLLPMMQQLQQSLHLKRERMIAYETMHEAAKEMAATDSRQGERTVNGRTYSWDMLEQLCVEYDDYRNRRQRVCVE
ncbi:hypothetical protein ACTL32_08150 [Planococcus sp. FY231025]|uniref:hypothetical protein n=1 Tax=Planococcus sp. FY231025 TaxID=3455699 RepID=UPI003F90DA9E